MIELNLRFRARALIDNRTFEIASLALVVFSLIAFVLETIQSLEARYASSLNALEALIVLLFTAEYLIRLVAAEQNRPPSETGGPGGRRYALSFLGIVDLVTILPFYLSILGIDGRPVRAFRLVRVFRVFKLVGRFGGALNRIKIGWALAKEELIFALVGSLLVIFMASVFIYFFERSAQPDAFGSVPDAIWWAVVTFTTVGYGDVTPITDGGKMFSFVLLLMALVMVGVPAGIVASALSMARETEAAEKWQIEYQQELDDENLRLTKIEANITALMSLDRLEQAKQKLPQLAWKRGLINPHIDSRQIYNSDNRKPQHRWDLKQQEIERKIQELEDGEN